MPNEATTGDEENIVIEIKLRQDSNANNKSGLGGPWDDEGKVL